MIRAYRFADDAGKEPLVEIPSESLPASGLNACWIDIVAPDETEGAWLQNDLGILPEFSQAALDDEERSRIDVDDETGQVLAIFDAPFIEDASDTENPEITQYDTHPLSFIALPDRQLVVTVSLRPSGIAELFSESKRRKPDPREATRFLLQGVLAIASRYIRCLHTIERQFKASERTLRNRLRNDELIKMLGFEKSLVYFSVSLKAMENTLLRLQGGRTLALSEDDADLLDDAIIEVKQAVEMCAIYTSILDSTTEAFGSIISNNVNATMRRLTIITLVIAVPTVVFGFYGMNTAVLPLDASWVFPLLITIILCAVAALIFAKSRLFK